ncbi:MAG: site-specific integrase [Candidatus Pacearchaeota archaeon]|jgi:integrase/recombinase XerC
MQNEILKNNLEIKGGLGIINSKDKELPKPSILLWQGPKNIKHSTKSFSIEEINLIFDTAKNNKEDYPKGELGEFYRKRDLCILTFIYYGALRPNEACSIRFNDIDFKDKTIFISGKNNKTRKDGIVRLSKQIMPYLEDYLSMPKRYWKNSEYLFPSSQRDHISPGTLKRVMREKVLKKCGLWEKGIGTQSSTRLYSLRHSRATHLLEQTKDLYLVSNVLRHSDIRTTASFYIHTNKEYGNYVQKAMDGESESLKIPDIQVNQQINQEVNIDLVVQQLGIVMKQQEEQNKVIMTLLSSMNKK